VVKHAIRGTQLNITLAQLQAIMPYAHARAALFLDPLNAAMDEFEINTPARIECFLAQVGHESGQFRYVEELASGEAYEGRKDLGNSEPGDGAKYKGRGLIQVTGRANYVAAMMALDLDCVVSPEVLCEPVAACRSAAWFWQSHGLNEIADAGDFEKLTRRINGGLNGEADRLALWEVAKKEIT
jgi:putative chitinase